jgi:hypothetical protein
MTYCATAPAICKKLRLEVNSRFVAAVHVEWYRLMLMRDSPLPVHFAEAESLACPDISFLAIAPHPTYPVKTMAEGNVIARRDAQVTDLVTNRALKRIEPLLHTILTGAFIPLELKWWREDKHNGVRGKVRRYAVGILGADSVCQLVSQRAYEGFIVRFIIFSRHVYPPMINLQKRLI